ncbi:MAG: YlxR family protein [Lachnospiraceae bacterium]|nr:YlxR family protein [Lachnospiraceae bacterium]
MAVKVRKIPLRKCTGCGEMKSKKELIRVLLEPDGNVTIDATGKKNGRGAYICNKLECFEKAVKTKGLERSLKTQIPAEVFEKLRNDYEWSNEQ